MFTDTEACYRAVKSKDRRFDGVFYTAVHTTGIYCRPSCPARTPASKNVSFFPTAAAAQSAGFRACKRCLPDATPGSPDWDVAADVAGRAMRLIADGVVDRDGVEGLATRLGYTSRHLGRVLGSELGAGPLALARARRAQTARILIETTTMTFADVAFAAGFASIRQFNDTIREVYASSPTVLRGRRTQAGPTTGQLTMRLAVRTPFAGAALLEFLGVRAVAGVESAGDGWYARALSLPHGPGTVRLELADALDEGSIALVPATFRLTDLRDTSAAVERVRRMLDADCDPIAVTDQLADDPLIGAQVRALPGLRVPGHVDGEEIAVRAVLGQQVSVAGARTVAGRLAAAHGAPLPPELMVDGLTTTFPTSGALATIDPDDLPMPRARGRALTVLCRALADGDVSLDRGAARDDVRRELVALPGIGPWTADYIAMRALGDPDVFLPTDVAVRNALTAAGADQKNAAALAESWRPWRSYALMYLLRSLARPEEMN
ncbi:DNA-3-methyladenine glycosylase 2 [Nocardioides jensenii]|uniref:DNA-3-methyladenine glycosylase 2 n=1 Tax=Nocardioides jensenii TaxID=1843 RepID=UPI000831BC38|nr:DNA-3-methyladenine glycosylase 2 [Nocardioides jensenii]